MPPSPHKDEMLCIKKRISHVEDFKTSTIANRQQTHGYFSDIKHNLRLLAIFLPVCTGLYCTGYINEASAVGSITLSPSTGLPGSAVTVTGSGFGNNTLVSVLVNHAIGANATTNESGTFSTTITMPTTASDGNHIITASDGVNSMDASFTVTLPVLNISPDSGMAGTTVNVSGSNFDPNKDLTIKFDGIAISTIPASVQPSNNGTFLATFNIPSTTTAGRHLITAEDGILTVPVAFDVLAAPPSSITLSATSGPGGTLVTVEGTGFAANSPLIIKLDSSTLATTPASITTTESGSFSAVITIPTGLAIGTNTISAVDVSGKTGSATFTIIKSGMVTLSSNAGIAGSTITVYGSEFNPNSSVTIQLDSTTLSAVTTNPSGNFDAPVIIPGNASVGSHTISVIDSFGRAASASFTIIRVNSEPKITISPTSGPRGSTVKITGSGFASDTSMAVLFDHALLTETRTDASGTFTVTVRIPTAAVAGSRSITLSDIPESVHATFNVTPPALLVSPNAGIPGTTVTVSGSSFGAGKGITIKFDDTNILTVPANLLSSSIGTFSATVSIPFTASAGGHTISATDDMLAASGVFNIPQTSVTLSNTSSAPGAVVTVTGTGFSANSPITVKFDSTKLVTKPTSVITSPSGTFSSTITIPAGLASGVDNISATDASGRTGSAIINIIAPAAITLSRTGGVQGSTVNISGFNFNPNSAITIKLDSTTLTTVPTTITANVLGTFEATVTIPDDASTGKHNISVIDALGKTTSSFFVVATHGIIAISPQMGPPGTEVIVNGWNFVNGTKISIKFNSIAVGTYPSEMLGSTLGKFIGKFRIPANVTEGTYTISAEDFTGRLGTAAFTVKDGLSLSLSPANGKGGTVYVAGWGFAPRSLVTISFDGEIVLTTPLKIFASRTGTFTASFNVPGNAPNGNHLISAMSNEKVTNATLILNRNYIDDRYGILISAFPQKYDFEVGEIVMISGKVLAMDNGFPLLLRVINPNGAACAFQQLSLDKDMKFEAEPVKLGGKLCSVEGEYKITAYYGKGKALTKFNVAASDVELTGGEAEVLNARLMPDFIRYDNKYTLDLDWASNAVRLRNNANQTITFYLMFAEFDDDEITKKLSYSEVTLQPFEKHYVVAPFVPQIIDGKPDGYLHVFAWTSLNEPRPLHPGLYVPY